MKSREFKYCLTAVTLFHIVVLGGCLAQTSITDDCRLIDSLVRINRISDGVILTSFGADAMAAIKTSKGIVLIDAGISTELAKKYRRVIREEFNSDDFRYLIITHAHPDHYGGCSVFRGTTVIGHENGINEISLQWKDRSQVIKAISGIVSEYEIKLSEFSPGNTDWNQSFTQLVRYRGALEDARSIVEVVYPGVRFSDALHLDLDDLNIEMIHFGSSHSNSDILVYVPEKKLLFTGDLFFKYGRPSITNSQMGDRGKWMRSVTWIEERFSNIETIISGHGEILSREDLVAFMKNISERGTNDEGR